MATRVQWLGHAYLQDGDAWAARVRQETQAQAVVLEPGEWMDV